MNTTVTEIATDFALGLDDDKRAPVIALGKKIDERIEDANAAGAPALLALADALWDEGMQKITDTGDTTAMDLAMAGCIRCLQLADT